MKKTPYYLHAVMVHQGEASGGHYWAYIRKHPALSITTPTSPCFPLGLPPVSSSLVVEPSDSRCVGDGTLTQTGQTGFTSDDEEASPARTDFSGDGDATNTATSTTTTATVTAQTTTLTITGQAGVRTSYHTQLETGEMYADVQSSPESPYEGMMVTTLPGPVASSAVTTPQIEAVMGNVTCEDGNIVVPGGAGGMCSSSSCTRGGEGMEVERCHTHHHCCHAPSVSVTVSSEQEGGGEMATWLKFNDVSVSEVSWEEVWRESIGGCRGNTSAYCLVYINRPHHQDWLNTSKECTLTFDLLTFDYCVCVFV